MLSTIVDLPASFGPEMRILPRCGNRKFTSRKSRNRSAFKCFRIIIYSSSNDPVATPLVGVQSVHTYQRQEIRDTHKGRRYCSHFKDSKRLPGVPLSWPLTPAVPVRLRLQQSTRQPAA